MAGMGQAGGSSAEPDGRTTGIALILATGLVFLAMAHHPSEGGRTDADIMAAIAGSGLQGALVHGTLIGIFAVFACCFTEFAVRLGLDRPVVRMGLVMYLAGCTAMLLGGSIDGFAVPAIARHFTGAGTGQVQIGMGVVLFGSVVAEIMVMLGLSLMSAGAVAWSVSLWLRSPAYRLTGGIGSVAGLCALAILLKPGGIGGPHGLMAVLVIHAIWNIAAASILLRHDRIGCA